MSDPEEAADDFSLSITPDAAIPTGCIMISAFIDSDGDAAWGYTVKGLAKVEAVGYLDLLKYEILTAGSD